MRDPAEEAAARTELRAGKLPGGVIAAYSAGAGVDGGVSNALNVFVLFYLTAVCGMPGALAGAALGVGLAADAVADPLLGALSDGWRSRLGRRLPMMLCGLPLVLMSVLAIFSLPAMLAGSLRVAVLVLLSAGLRIGVSMVNLPYLAVGAELSEDHRERARLMTWRWAGGMAGALLAIGLGFGVYFAGPGGLSNGAAYPSFAIGLDLLVLGVAVPALWAIFVTRNRQHLPNPPRGISGLAADFREVFASRSFRVLFAGAILFFLSQGVTLSLSLHANRFFWQLEGPQIHRVTMAFFTGLLLGAPAVGPLVARLENRTALFLGIGGLLLTQAGPAMLRLFGFLPLAGAALSWVLAAVTALGGALMSMAAIAFMSMMADAADEHEYRFGTRREGLYFAGWAFAGKAAHGAGAFLSGVILQAIGFPSGVSGEIAPDSLAPGTVSALGFFAGPGAAGLALAGTSVLLWYRLDRAKHRALLTAIQARRQRHFNSISGEIAG